MRFFTTEELDDLSKLLEDLKSAKGSQKIEITKRIEALTDKEARRT